MHNPPISTTALFPKLDLLLIDLLQNATLEDWNKPTIAKKWKVKDIVAHLLDGNIRSISIFRDNYFGEPPENIETYADLVNFLNNLNATWVTAAKRLSPQLLIELLSSTGKTFCNEISKLDPEADAVFPVAWAGETASKNWFHTAREYTEKFIHQMQIRDALNRKDVLFTQELFTPFITTFMYALPYTYRDVEAEDKTVVEIKIDTAIGGTWFLIRFDGNWVLDTQSLFTPAAKVAINPDTAWKLFSKGLSKAEARPLVNITGAVKLGEKVLDMIAIMG